MHTPVIMISALEDAEVVARCIAMGADDDLPKPFDPGILRARLGSSLAKKRLHDREQVYARRVAAAGLSDRVVQRAIRGVAHCDFTAAGSCERSRTS